MEAETTGRKKLPSTHTAEADLLQLLTAEAIYPGKETNNLSVCSVDWFVSLLVRKEVLLTGSCERKIPLKARNLRSFTTITKRAQPNEPA